MLSHLNCKMPRSRVFILKLLSLVPALVPGLLVLMCHLVRQLLLRVVPGLLVLMCHLVRQLLLRVLSSYSFNYATILLS